MALLPALGLNFGGGALSLLAECAQLRAAPPREKGSLGGFCVLTEPWPGELGETDVCALSLQYHPPHTTSAPSWPLCIPPSPLAPIWPGVHTRILIRACLCDPKRVKATVETPGWSPPSEPALWLPCRAEEKPMPILP